MDATRAGKGCGSCKTLVGELVEWLCGGEVEEDPSVHYYVPTIPLRKPDLAKAIREQNLKSVSAVFKALAGGVEDAPSKPALASLLITLWHKDYEDERDARFINDRVHANIQKDGTFSVIPEIAGGVCTPAELKRIAEVAVKYKVPLVKLTGGQRIDLVGVPKHELPDIWRDLGMAAGYAWGKSYRKELHRGGLLSLRARRQHGARGQDRAAFSWHRHPRQTQARDRRLPAQLL
jgi:nitrite reductase (NADH) large subunit